MRRISARPWLGVTAAAVALVAVTVVRSPGPAVETRLPGRYRLVDLIQQQQAEARDLREEVSRLRGEVERERAAVAGRTGRVPEVEEALVETAGVAGLTALGGPGVRVTLDDSDRDQPPPGGTVNDLVVHSQDVQAVVNALWRAGAEAVAINGQRLVGTSAVLCVGNTLLLNGTVHSPPFVVTALGASRDTFEGDRLVRRLRSAVDSFGLRFSVERDDELEVPAYPGPTKPTYARPA